MKLIKPNDCDKHTSLLQSLPIIQNNNDDILISNEEAYILGVFFGCGICEIIFNDDNDIDFEYIYAYIWSINNNNAINIKIK